MIIRPSKVRLLLNGSPEARLWETGDSVLLWPMVVRVGNRDYAHPTFTELVVKGEFTATGPGRGRVDLVGWSERHLVVALPDGTWSPTWVLVGTLLEQETQGK